MSWTKRAWLAIGAMFGLAGTTQAQGKIDVPEALIAGQAVTVGYFNQELAGQTITVTVDNGDPEGAESVDIQIELGENGYGSASWTVPASDWDAALFNAPQAEEVARMVKS